MNLRGFFETQGMLPENLLAPNGKLEMKPKFYKISIPST